MHIGAKIQRARTSANLTQEQAAEALGVSRQTISNWENEKTYPDIVSVVKMSDLYAVSLDQLLKEQEETVVSDYVDYLGKSTNTVLSHKQLSMIILTATYLGIWALALIVFWCFTSGSDAMGYSIMFFYIVLPVTTFLISLLIDRQNCWGKGKWALPVLFGVMHMLAEYATFSTANMIAFDKINPPNLRLLLAGAVISAAGFGIGSLARRGKRKSAEKQQAND